MHRKLKHCTLFLLIFLLGACAEPYYRGIPSSQWQQLSAEQKSLLIDQAYNNDVNRAEPNASGTLTAQTPLGTFGSPGENSGDVMLSVLNPTVQIQKHHPMPATLVWQAGTVSAGMGGGGFGPASRSYSKAQQVVFMTSLQRALEQQQAFQTVTLVAIAPEKVTQPVITVYFKSTRVSDNLEGNKITLSVVLRIAAPGQALFTRTYLLSSVPAYSFIKQEEEISTALLDKLLQGINDWASGTQLKK